MHHLIGHAIVSADDRIADSSGRIPDALRNERDWELFQAALDRADITLIGRASHDATPNRKRRRRLIVSRSARGLEERIDGFWLNPADMPLAIALETILPGGGEVAVVGGQEVFELSLQAGLHAFHLARVRRLLLSGGRGLFAASERGIPAAEILSRGGLVADVETTIDPEADVTLTIWRRPVV